MEDSINLYYRVHQSFLFIIFNYQVGLQLEWRHRKLE